MNCARHAPRSAELCEVARDRARCLRSAALAANAKNNKNLSDVTMNVTHPAHRAAPALCNIQKLLPGAGPLESTFFHGC